MYQIETVSKGLVAHGVSTCHGCGLEFVIRTVVEELGPRTIIVIPPGCSAVFSGCSYETALKIPGFQGNLENTAAYAAGISRSLRVQGIEDVHVLGFAGDGATVDIGLQALSGAMERNENIIYVCYDNEAYMNTGIQGSGSTSYHAWTTTTPAGKKGMPKDMMMIAKAHKIPYAASASVGYLDDLKRKVKKAKNVKGMAYLHVCAPCPTGWGYKPEDTVKIAKLAVDTGAWALYEIEDGKVHITKNVANRKPIEEYLKIQKRFRGMSDDDIRYLGEQVAKNCDELERLEKLYQ
ncbi:MAG: thiamine pyrophosphate-dependent enzyme [Anaerotruncus rubiinfantis]|jgi:pyruvate ferredoxin oxidoreductase beta subunit|uniref:thiamine pyrophosphate-dependent enzyme n=1 Tax=Anaerotruncus rubiinfantis TaxID=1720200 RepID=UPI00189C1828|nr:thiamine pyrophosphate-dependent enzyme [Anaerotruncus rubiinfantis]